MTADGIRCKLIKYSSAEYAATVVLRNEILRKPLGLQFTDEQLRAESNDHHIACFLDGCIVACLVLTPQDDGVVRMRQVAVVADRQRKGIGAALVRYCEQYAEEQGYREVVAHARDTAVPFYEKLGYEVIGDRFNEVGIPHVTVRKALKEKQRGL